MIWSKHTTRYGSVGDWRLRYVKVDDGIRMFLLEPRSHHDYRLLFTRVYESVAHGASCIMSDYQEAVAIAPDGCEVCGEPLSLNPRAKYCSRPCQRKAGARRSRERQRASA